MGFFTCLLMVQIALTLRTLSLHDVIYWFPWLRWQELVTSTKVYYRKNRINILFLLDKTDTRRPNTCVIYLDLLKCWEYIYFLKAHASVKCSSAMDNDTSHPAWAWPLCGVVRRKLRWAATHGAADEPTMPRRGEAHGQKSHWDEWEEGGLLRG